MAQERLQKIIAASGVASRRKAEELIRDGSVTINGKKASIGDKADPEQDSIKVSGKLIPRLEAKVYYAFNKPAGVISMVGKDPDGRPTLSSVIELNSRVYPVDRIEYNGEGLLLLTNDGELSSLIQNNQEIIRGYEVRVTGHPTPEQIQKLLRGTVIQGRRTKPMAVSKGARLASKLKIQIWFQGMGSLDIRELFKNRGFLVSRVIRTHIGQLRLKGIPRAGIKTLKKSQVLAMLKQPELALRGVERSLKSLERAIQPKTGAFVEATAPAAAARRPAGGKKANSAGAGRARPASAGPGSKEKKKTSFGSKKSPTAAGRSGALGRKKRPSRNPSDTAASRPKRSAGAGAKRRPKTKR